MQKAERGAVSAWTLVTPWSSIWRISPGSISRRNWAPMRSSAQLSEATTQPSRTSPPQGGGDPLQPGRSGRSHERLGDGLGVGGGGETHAHVFQLVPQVCAVDQVAVVGYRH